MPQQFAIDITLAPNATRPHIAEFAKYLAAFVRVGAHGGFVEPDKPPREASLSLVTQQLEGPEKLSFLLEANSLDARAFVVLRNLARKFGERVHRIYKMDIKLVVPSAQALHILFPPLTWDNAYDIYPALSNILAVRVEADDPLDYHKGRRCIVEFQQREVREKLGLLQEWIDDWATVVECGGYSLPVKEPHEAEAWIDTLQIYDEYSVEVVFSLFDAAEEAWRPLINMMDRFSVEVGSLALVSIE